MYSLAEFFENLPYNLAVFNLLEIVPGIITLPCRPFVQDTFASSYTVFAGCLPADCGEKFSPPVLPGTLSWEM